MELENTLLIKIPIQLLLPNIKINKNPITVGGKTMGNSRKVSSSSLPLNCFRDNILPKIIPIIKTSITDIEAVFNDMKMGDQNSSCDKCINPIL